MLDTHRIRRRIEEIRKRQLVLEKHFKGIPQEKFLDDIRLNAEAERHLQIAIQACLDIANHIVASLGLERPAQVSSEVFITLAKENILPEDFVETMEKMTGYRNVVVHDYMRVDRDITYDNIQNHLPDLAKFAQYIEKFLQKQLDKNKSNET